MEELIRLTQELEEIKARHKPIMDRCDSICDMMDDICSKMKKAYQEGMTTELLEEYDRISILWIDAIRDKHSILDPILSERDKLLDVL